MISRGQLPNETSKDIFTKSPVGGVSFAVEICQMGFGKVFTISCKLAICVDEFGDDSRFPSSGWVLVSL